MARMTRRKFLMSSLAGGACAGLFPHARVLGANDDLRVGVVGFRSQGGLHIRLLQELPGVRVVALCDADRQVLEGRVAAFRKLNQQVAAHTDVRRLLESKEVDAITTATPDHWHALVTIWACQAGKDVYVEKPVSHNVFEGRKMVEAARKYNRIVQFGNAGHGQATAANPVLEHEKLGRIRVVHNSLNRGRRSIGKVNGPQPVPASVDYNLYCGPAPQDPPRRTTFHYDWHWFWPTGTGELGNNGIYPLDQVRLALGQKTLPRRVLSLGGRFTFDDSGETPNTQICLFEYDPGPLLIFELRNLSSERGGQTMGAKIKCERGEAGLPRPSARPGDTGTFTAHKGHLWNFLSVVRSRRLADLRADVLEGHLSTALVHMANISYRLGTPRSLQQAREVVQDRGSEAVETLERFRTHLEANGVNFTNAQVTVGPWLEMDARTEQFVGSNAARANPLLRREYRAPFVVPENV